MYRIRQVDPDEFLDELAELHALTFTNGESHPDYTKGHWWIAFFGDAPAGFIGVTRSNKFQNTGYFHRVGVAPKHRGNGIQLRLMRAMERHARKIGWHRIVSDTRDNPPSANNLIAAGYQTFSPSNPWAHRDAIYWTKELL